MHSSVHNAVGNEREHCAMSDNVKMNGFVTSHFPSRDTLTILDYK